MRIIRNLDDVPRSCRDAVVALGNFDGVHRGHAAVIGEAGRIAAEAGAARGVLTFEPHPRRFFRPDETRFELTPLTSKARQIAALGVDVMFVLDFDAAFSRVTAEDFVQRVLIEGISARHLVVGYDFVFGHGRKGDVALLRRLGEAAGVGVAVVDKVVDEAGEACSSTTIRRYIADGRPERAARLLGRCWEIEGEVVTGDRRGREIGFPTANVDPGAYLEPALGVYAVWAGLDDGGRTVWRKGVANIGRRPTFGGERVNLEVHIFDFADDIYGRMLRVAPVRHLRPEKAFDGLEAIRAQIADDGRAARAVLDAVAAGDLLGPPGGSSPIEATCGHGG